MTATANAPVAPSSGLPRRPAGETVPHPAIAAAPRPPSGAVRAAWWLAAWLAACVGIAASPAAAEDFPSCGVGTASCFEEDLFGTGCADPLCCNIVCSVEPACCDTAWDKLCVALAFKLCDRCGAVPNSCFEVAETPNCSNVGVCNAVCEVLPECCLVAWDADCVAVAEAICSGCGNACAGPCFAANPEVGGCSNEACCNLIAIFDPFCKFSWDARCAVLAKRFCLDCGSDDAGNCCFENDTPFCRDGLCCNRICNGDVVLGIPADPFCCEVRWDAQCAEAATLFCGLVGCTCGDPAAGNCFVPHAGGGCDLFTCCNDVCAVDPFCCGVEWDLACATTAERRCTTIDVCGVPGSGSCFIPWNPKTQKEVRVGCDDAGCCDRVCRIPGFEYCCGLDDGLGRGVGWDAACVEKALEVCNDCGDPFTGSCFVGGGSAACNNPECCEAVCRIDDFCCTVIWDELCASIAGNTCADPVALCGSPRTRNCFVASSIGACSDEKCCTDVCTRIDPYCCEVAWDEVCVSQAAAFCGPLQPGRGPCLAPHPEGGCVDPICTNAVCSVLPECCENRWDQRCVEAAYAICIDPDSGFGEGDCQLAHSTPGCVDPICTNAVCLALPECCTVSWDQDCVNYARFNCIPRPSWRCPCEGSCFEGHGGIGCSEKTCCAVVCNQQPECCEIAWDTDCARLARSLCCGSGDCGDVCLGSCFEVRNVPGCSDPFCCESVCSIDPLCCTASWDFLCVEAAAIRCIGGCGLPSAGSCFEARPTAGCDDANCCVEVCKQDPVCCEASWDGVCRDLALKVCKKQLPICGDFAAGDCCAANGTPNCRDAACCATVCEKDSFCCDEQWDDACVQIARGLEECRDCQLECGDPCAGSCCEPGSTPYCNDGDCCAAVCAIDAFCCDGQWDEFCAATASSPLGPKECAKPCPVPPCGDPVAGSCCVPNGTPNCSDKECCTEVCAVDSFCCDVSWDLTCAISAGELCGPLCVPDLFCGSGEAGSCFSNNSTPYCNNLECCETVCFFVDIFCCTVRWDDTCAIYAKEFCEGP